MNGAAMYSSVKNTGVDVDVLKHVPLVKRIAYHLLGKLPDSVLVDDLIQAGMLGLLEAAKKYDISQGASFETYAGIRIRGAMLDEVRRSDWTPRSVHKKARMVAEAIREIENKTGQDAKDSDVATYLNITVHEYHQILQDSSSSRTFSIEELAQSGDHILEQFAERDMGPAEKQFKVDFSKALAQAITDLPEREKLVVSLYYDNELNLKEIGQILGVGESRVSQISSQAMLRLRARLAEWTEENTATQ
jgi:RNA polymerase sigma factor for flagellar operon FliA